MADEDFESTGAAIKATQGTRVEVELFSESGEKELLAFDLVPDEDADLDDGLLGLGTPLGRAIKGKTAGDTVAYNVGDIRLVRILKVAYSRRSLSDTNAAANRQVTLQKAVSQSDLAEAVRFATTFNSKWGDYDPEGIAAHWQASRPDDPGEPGGKVNNEPVLVIRPMNPGEETGVCDLVMRVFTEFVAPGYGPEGLKEFHKYVDPAALLKRSEAGHFVLIAAVQGQLAGVIEMRHHEHICLLFVDRQFLRRGIAKALLLQALDVSRQHNPDLERVTVNSSPYAVPVYEKLGFVQTGPEQVKNGIRFVPMALGLGGQNH